MAHAADHSIKNLEQDVRAAASRRVAAELTTHISTRDALCRTGRTLPPSSYLQPTSCQPKRADPFLLIRLSQGSSLKPASQRYPDLKEA